MSEKTTSDVLASTARWTAAVHARESIVVPFVWFIATFRAQLLGVWFVEKEEEQSA